MKLKASVVEEVICRILQSVCGASAEIDQNLYGLFGLRLILYQEINLI